MGCVSSRAGKPETLVFGRKDSHVFGPLEPELLKSKIPGVGDTWDKIGYLEPEPLGKKVWSRSRLISNRLPSPGTKI